MFKATASVAAALFQWQDRLGSSMKTIKKKENNASVLCRDNKMWLFVSREFVGAEWLRASHRWVSIKFRHHEGIPSPTWLCLKVEFLSVSNIGLKGNVFSCVSLPNTHMEPGKTRKGFGMKLEAKQSDLIQMWSYFWCIIIVLSRTFTWWHPLLVLCGNHLLKHRPTTDHLRLEGYNCQ